TLDVGDALVAGTAFCKIRAMQDEYGRAVDRAGPSKPVQILGWSHVPSAGDDFREVEDEREARHVAEEREAKARAAELVTARRAEGAENLLGAAEVRQIFRVPRLGVVAGSYVRSGTMRRNAAARLVRDGVIVYDGKIGSLRRFKDDVAEVREGYECGISLENY